MTIALYSRKVFRFLFFYFWRLIQLKQKNKQQTVFILGHMRSGSSLLMHLLIAHRQLNGYGERNAIYRTEKDFTKLVAHTRFERQDFFHSYNYFVDQINHNHHTPNVNLLKGIHHKYIFLIRNPANSISSILKLSRTYYDGWSVEKSTEYYINRLNFLVELAKELSETQELCLIRYEDITLNTKATLLKLKQYLQLKKDLKEQYPIHHFTGLKGDPSSNIKSGKIIKTHKKEYIPLPPRLLADANLIFEQSYKKLSTYCGSSENLVER